MKEAFVDINFKRSSLITLATISDIVEEYQRQGYMLTSRQVYYQLVARGVIDNNLAEYKRIASLINDGKMAGILDWAALEDRTREFIDRPHWHSGKDLLEACAGQYHEDLWQNQDHRVFVIIEKEALVGVLSGLCRQYDVPILAARGYPSGSVLYDLCANTLPNTDQQILVLHLGDHDPSGIDMSRDLEDRINLLSRGMIEQQRLTIKRLALNINQVRELKPPENPAKVTDSRAKAYIKKFGSSSWELDALSPEYLNNLVREEIENVIDPSQWADMKERIADIRNKLHKVASGVKF